MASLDEHYERLTRLALAKDAQGLQDALKALSLSERYDLLKRLDQTLGAGAVCFPDLAGLRDELALAFGKAVEQAFQDEDRYPFLEGLAQELNRDQTRAPHGQPRRFYFAKGIAAAVRQLKSKDLQDWSDLEEAIAAFYPELHRHVEEATQPVRPASAHPAGPQGPNL